jgi:hypothetical protein
MVHGAAYPEMDTSSRREGAQAMNPLPMNSSASADYELHFQSLHDAGCACTFPCDSAGHVALDALSDAVRDNYLFARAVVGRELSAPVVVSGTSH